MNKLKNYWDRKADIYNKMFNKSKLYSKMYNFIIKSLNSDMNVLELGTATGLIAREIASSVNTVKATDFSEKMIRKANSIPHDNNVSFFCADIFNLPFDENSFDAVVVANVLHIIPNPDKALFNIYRVLKPNGLLIAPTYMWNDLSFKGKIMKFFMMKAGFPLFSKWNVSTYQKVIEDNGFSISEIKELKSSVPICCVNAFKQ